MEQKVRYIQKDKTILEKIGISDEKVKLWKSKGVKISYPMKLNKKFFKSEDGEIFVETADKFVIPLTKQETKIYTKLPEKFREDFLKNINIYRDFYDDFLFPLIEKVEILEPKERIISLLSLLYLFQVVMDHHYYHFDRYLAYENYPKTPVGYWFKKFKYFYTKFTKRKFSKVNPQLDFLKILARDKKTISKFKNKLSKRDFIKLKEVLKVIKIFEEVQQEEVKIAIDLKTKENIAIRTGLPIWNGICEIIKKNPKLLERKHISSMKKITAKHPIVGIREILYRGIKYFNKDIIFEFEREIKRWI